ncbi:PIG-L family deacetylase [Aspergillus alliaceus]|uniref:PIG-L family deacetylase n=1 Tax=Petromyces alliaceus TaxID=209559 RepID=UPI0012A7419B|nr:putative deacetylase LmbE-like domain-containing protein [Aspergillus alliaceus]KAB8239304.1 putative deacetylase LmbE-like domain-containing protein [Aspergillus alliaceus]
MRISSFLGAVGFLHQLHSSAAQTLNIVAHQDDDLLFTSPDLLHAIQASRKVRTVFLTAGDAGETSTGYWEQRQAGSQAAYAQMANVDNAWTQSDAGIHGKNIPLFTLNGNPDISLAFLQLPDGNLGGNGFPNTGSASLQKLWQSEISSIQAVNGSTSYTSDELLNALATLMSDFQPDRVNTLDYVHGYGDGDHSDHHTTAYYVQKAAERYTTGHTLTGYTGYPIQSMAQNVLDDDLKAKQSAFFTYAAHDSKVCHDLASCGNGNEAQWLQRQYAVTGEPVANARTLTARRAVEPEERVVLDGGGQTADKAIDGMVDGYPGLIVREWATVGGKAGSILTLTWNNPQIISEIYLCDRPNVNDQVTGGSLRFDNGSSVPVNVLDNYGSP